MSAIESALPTALLVQLFLPIRVESMARGRHKACLLHQKHLVLLVKSLLASKLWFAMIWRHALQQNLMISGADSLTPFIKHDHGFLVCRLSQSLAQNSMQLLALATIFSKANAHI